MAENSTVRVSFGDTAILLERGESVLTALTRSGIDVPSSCRAGICQSCLMQAVDAPPPAAAQKGLKASAKERGQFLACLCHPTTDMSCTLAGDELKAGSTEIMAAEPLQADVLRVVLSKPEGFSYRPGQFVNLRRADGLMRSYSLASQPNDETLELHVRMLPGGAMSQWLAEPAALGQKLDVYGPLGDCCYSDGDLDEPILLAATGTGLAPLYGILNDALAKGHQGEIRLYHGALSDDRLYFTSELADLAGRYPNVVYTRVVKSEGPASATLIRGDLVEAVLAEQTKQPATRAFLCGAPDMVNTLKKRLFLSGLSLANIHADAFLAAKR